MNCPVDDKWLLELLGELSVNEARELERHRLACAQCTEARSACQQLMSDLEAKPAFALSDEAFVAGVVARARTHGGAVEHRGRTLRGTRLRWWAAGAGLVAAAAASLLLAVGLGREERYTARGTGIHLERLATARAELFFMRAGMVRPFMGAELTAGDGILVRASNPTDAPRYLAVFVVDSAREVHWIYPSYVDPAFTPESIRLEPGAGERVLPEVVEPDTPALGPLTAVALFTGAPTNVRELEELIGRMRPGDDVQTFLRVVFEGSQVQEWSARWIQK